MSQSATGRGKKAVPSTKSKSVDTKTTERARSLLIELTELIGKTPNVRQDPVVKSLLSGLTVEKNSEFQMSALTVATLRNAGCLDTNKATADPSSGAPTGPQDPKKKQKSDETASKKEGNARPVKPRGYSRTTDVLIEDAVFRGEVAKKDDHPVAVNLRELRKDPLKEVEVKRIMGVYKDVTYPNGKKGRVLDHIPIEAASNAPYFDIEKVKVKDLDDLDLIATQSPLIAYKQYVQDGLLKVFSWVNGDYTIPEDPGNAWPSLKGTETLGLISNGKDLTQKNLLDSLSAEKFLRARPSPTILWDGWNSKDYDGVTFKVGPKPQKA